MPVPQFATGLLLKVGMGVTTAAAAIGGAGAVGALPGPVQSAFDASVETVTPFELDDSTENDASLDETTDPTLPAEEEEVGEESDLEEEVGEVGEDDETGEDQLVDDESADDETTDELTEELCYDPEAEVNEYDPEVCKNFGEWVSAQAREGGVDGREISAAAHAKNEARKAGGEEVVDDGTESTDDEATVESQSTKPGPKGKANKGPKRGR